MAREAYGDREIHCIFRFILEDREKRIPDKHPVALELYNPRGQFYTKMISTQGMNGFYTFDRADTSPEDPDRIMECLRQSRRNRFPQRAAHRNHKAEPPEN